MWNEYHVTVFVESSYFSLNRKAKRKIRSINNIIRTLLAHASLPQSFLRHALQVPTYLLYIIPSELLANKSTLQILYKVPSYYHNPIFRCLCYPLFWLIIITKLQDWYTLCALSGTLLSPWTQIFLIFQIIKLLFSTMLSFMRTYFLSLHGILQSFPKF